MQFDWWTLALQTVNFLVLVWLLHRFLYRPVLGIVEARRAEIDAQYASARGAEEKAQAELAEIETERASIASERTAALKSAADEAEAASAISRAKAEDDARTLLDQTRKSLASERDAALVDARRRAFELAVSISQKLLDEFPPELRADAWLHRVEQHLAALSVDERQDITGQLDSGGTLRVISAVPLPESATTKWRTRLRHIFGSDVPIEFDVDSALIAGVELHFPHAILRFSWRSVMELMQSEIANHEDVG
jgi:F-type H+-transporting ATPase subunit b